MRIKQYFTALVLSAALFSCTQNKHIANKNGVSIIFETDMGNDIDDALALDMLYKYIERGDINLLAISSNKDNVYSAEYIDIMNTWYGYPDIPIGIVEDGADCENDAVNYAKYVCELKEQGKPMFQRSIKDYSSLTPAVELYRKVLSAEPDNSVTIISVGFSTNLGRLLDSKPDQYSPLNGTELVAKKVKLLSLMGCSFGDSTIREYNVVKDIPNAKKVFSLWPTPIVASTFEIGIDVYYPAASIENDFGWAEKHPMIEGYKAYLPMPYSRPTWDLISVVYAIDPSNELFTESAKGSIYIRETDTNDLTEFVQHEDGKHSYLSADPQQAKTLQKYFVDLITQRPRTVTTSENVQGEGFNPDIVI